MSSLVSAEPSSCKDRENYDKEFMMLDEQLSSEHPRLESWDYLHRFYLGLVKRFPECDNGVRGQRLSDEVGYLLSVRWDQFSRLENIAEKDKDFAEFVINHLNDSAEPKTFEAIIENTTHKCSDKAKDLCFSIEKRAETLLKSSRRSLNRNVGDHSEHSRQ
jgi:hypothetical protein